MTEPHSRCHACGAPYAVLEWPRTCPHCKTQAWRRIDPVGVLLQPVRLLRDRVGILVGRRGIEPQLGRYALPGGFAEFGEAIEEAVQREAEEEMGIIPTGLKFYGSFPTPGGQLLFVFRGDVIGYQEVAEGFTASTEVTGFDVILKPKELAFPIHTEVVQYWFESN